MWWKASRPHIYNSLHDTHLNKNNMEETYTIIGVCVASNCGRQYIAEFRNQCNNYRSLLPKFRDIGINCHPTCPNRPTDFIFHFSWISYSPDKEVLPISKQAAFGLLLPHLLHARRIGSQKGFPFRIGSIHHIFHLHQDIFSMRLGGTCAAHGKRSTAPYPSRRRHDRLPDCCCLVVFL